MTGVQTCALPICFPVTIAQVAIRHRKNGLWNEEDGFFYDVLQLNDGTGISLKLRSIVGLIPMFAVEVIEHEMLQKLPNFTERMDWILKNKPELAKLIIVTGM